MVEGYFYRKGQSRQTAAVASLAEGSLTIHEAGADVELARAPLERVKVSERLGNTPRYLSFPDGSRFDTHDNDAVDVLVSHYQHSSTGLIHWLESRFTAVLLLLAVTLVSVWGMIEYGVPAGAKVAAKQIPTNYVVDAGQQTLTFLDRGMFTPSQLTEAQQQALRQTFQDSLGYYQGELPIRIHFRDSKAFGANAFALMSGDVIFTDDLVRLACNSQELTSIFGHEVGHVALRHGTRSLLQNSVLALAAMLIFGDSTGVSELLAAAPALLLERGYSRDFEREADDYGLAYLTANQIDPSHFTDIMSRLAAQRTSKEGGLSHYFSTHPETASRTQKFGQGRVGECQPWL